ncbi:hypothetical protein AGMMS49991_03200 [Spirochaetia bacterium]|nr:hypothetical protein AGMMS49991_03200 [Spirochaetia bacterium]
MNIIDRKILSSFDITINRYLVFLVHVQKSTLMQITDKISIFETAKGISNEVYANVQKTLNNINEYNIEEKRKYIEQTLLNIEVTIVNELNNKYKNIKINEDALFLLNDIIEKLTNIDNGVGLSNSTIHSLFSYKDLDNERERQKSLDEQLKKIQEKMDNSLEETKKKAFFNMLHGKNENAERFYEANKLILEKCKTQEIKLIVDNTIGEIKIGLFFIINKNNITIKRTTENSVIEYTITFNDFEDKFNINIQGNIKVNNSKDTFFIDEIYPNNMRGSVLNTYNLKKIIEIFNELYSKNYTSKKILEDKNKEEIDNFLSGKIQND